MNVTLVADSITNIQIEHDGNKNKQHPNVLNGIRKGRSTSSTANTGIER
jgi:hypothetical protein